MLKRVVAKCAVGLMVAGTAVGLAASPSSAHVSIVAYGTTFTAGATNVVYFRVPHACSSTAVTNKVTVTIPAAVTGVKPQVIPGWTVSRTLNGTATATVTWESTNRSYDLRDWQFMDFGIRATLNGNDGDVIVFDSTTQFCDYDESGNALGSPETEVWTGVDAPKLTLVGVTKKVATAADLATLRNDATTIGVRVTALEASLTETQTTIQRVLSQIGITNAPASVSLGNGRLSYVLDLSTVWRSKTLDIVVSGSKIGTARLDRVGDAANYVIVASSSVPSGSTVDFVWSGFTLASARLG